MNGARGSDATGDLSSAGADDSSPSGLHFFLVRLIPAGTICWVGTIHRLRHPATDGPIRRGDRVVIQNAQGKWLAEVLRAVGSTDPPAEGASGELLRIATAEDERAEKRSLDKRQSLREATLRDRIAPGLSIVATEVSLDHRIGIIRILGAADDRFGPAAVRLASELGLQRVQWIDVSGEQQATRLQPETHGRNAEPRECTPEAAEDAAFWQRMRRVVREAVSLGATHRVAAGNRGLYQQKLRDPKRPSEEDSGRPSSGSASVERCWMIRIRTAAGGITAKQLERLCGLARSLGDGSLRLTTRQAIQLHNVAIGSAPEVMRQLQDTLLHSAGSCGNTVRNLTCCPLPPRSAAERHLRELAARLAKDSLPVGPPFECEPEWLDTKPIPSRQAGLDWTTGDVAEMTTQPFVSPVLPHKWKIGLAVAGHNCIDVLNNDLAIVLRRESGFGGAGPPLADVFVGGSTAYQPDRAGSKPQLASWLGTISTAEIADLLAALIELFQARVLGERRHFRRWKYVVDRLGVEAIRSELRSELRSGSAVGHKLQAGEKPPFAETLRFVEHPIENVQSDGRVTFCIPISGGRIRCNDAAESALRNLATLPITIRVAPHHRLVVADVRHQHLPIVRQSLATIQRTAATGQRRAADALLEDDHFSVATSLPPIRNAVACPALPTCPLAVDEAERVLPKWERVVHELALVHDLPAPRFAISGCGNGCSRPLTTEIGVVAEKRGKRRVFFGGNGSRLGRSVGVVENLAAFQALLASWLRRYASSKRENEDFGDWFFRSSK